MICSLCLVCSLLNIFHENIGSLNVSVDWIAWKGLLVFFMKFGLSSAALKIIKPVSPLTMPSMGLVALWKKKNNHDMLKRPPSPIQRQHGQCVRATRWACRIVTIKVFTCHYRDPIKILTFVINIFHFRSPGKFLSIYFWVDGDQPMSRYLHKSRLLIVGSAPYMVYDTVNSDRLEIRHIGRYEDQNR